MDYSVVVPLKNEEGNVKDLVGEIEPVMEGLKKPWELILIDDGSTDQTLSIIRELKKIKPYLRIIVFDRNYGQTSAFEAGFKAAKGHFVITLDGDRQNDPRDIPRLLALSETNDLVVGWRKDRKSSFFKRCTSKIANSIRGNLCQDHVHDTGCSLKVYKKESLDRIKLFHGMHRFLPSLFVLEGMSVAEIPVNDRARVQGTTKYNIFNRSFNTIADLLAVRWMHRRKLKYKIRETL